MGVGVLSADWVLPVEGAAIENGAVAVEDGRIAAVRPAAELGAGERFADAVIIPGFVNAHSHLEYAAYAGFGDALEFAPWIALHVERKRRIGADEALAIARAGAAECLRSGITCVGDASFLGVSAPACAELGLRATVYLEVFEGHEERFQRHRERWADAYSQRVRLGISPHAPYTGSVELYAACVRRGLPLMTHFAETLLEQEWSRTGRGPLPGVRPTSIRELAAHGLLVDRLVAAHCVHVDGEEIALLAEHDVAVAHCPRSNALLGCGIAPLRELLAAGVRVGIGTDSPASAPSFDMFAELRAAVMLARARERRAGALVAADALMLATLGSARALGLEGEIGSLLPGKRADLAVVSLAGSAFLPWEDPAGAVVFGGSPDRVLLTMVDGRTTYRKGQGQCHELIAGARLARERLLGRRPEARATRAPTSAPRDSSSSGCGGRRSGCSSSSPPSSPSAS